MSGNVNVWNQKASQVTGFTTEGVMGRNLVREFITQDYQDSVQEVGVHCGRHPSAQTAHTRLSWCEPAPDFARLRRS